MWRGLRFAAGRFGIGRGEAIGEGAVCPDRPVKVPTDQIDTPETASETRDDLLQVEEEPTRFSALADATFEAIVISADRIIVDSNTAFEDLVGLPLNSLRNRAVLDFVDEADRPFVCEQLARSEAGPYELRVVHSDGTRIPVEVRAREITYRSKPARVSAIVDLRDRKRAEERIRHLARHDPLTDLPNRAVFAERLDQAIDQASSLDIQAAVLMLNLDRLKDINDLHGHIVGDRVIRATADRLLGAVRRGDTVARIGSDEFAIIQTNVEFATHVTVLAQRLIDLLSEPIDGGDGLEVRCTASVGVAVFPTHGEAREEVVSRADIALVRAKSQGRNRYCMFEEGMDAAERKRRALEADLERAIECNEFELLLQPRLSLEAASFDSYEALIRWRHPRKGTIGPDDFIPVAEQSGNMVAIGTWAVRSACALARQHLGDARISVNVSPVQLRDAGFAETVRVAIQDSGISANRLEIEVTENALIDDDTRAVDALSSIKELGCHVVLDDFGTGYSSLGFLSQFPFDGIKIDRSFVRAAHTSKNAQAIIETIVCMGRAMTMKIVAEGIETIEEFEVVAERRCDEAQGFLIGRPASVEDLQSIVPVQVLNVLQSDSVDPERKSGRLHRAASVMRAASVSAPSMSAANS